MVRPLPPGCRLTAIFDVGPTQFSYIPCSPSPNLVLPFRFRSRYVLILSLSRKMLTVVLQICRTLCVPIHDSHYLQLTVCLRSIPRKVKSKSRTLPQKPARVCSALFHRMLAGIWVACSVQFLGCSRPRPVMVRKPMITPSEPRRALLTSYVLFSSTWSPWIELIRSADLVERMQGFTDERRCLRSWRGDWGYELCESPWGFERHRTILN